MRAKLTPVRMMRSYRKWNSGEIAGFSPEQADFLVKQGIAIPYTVAVPGAAPEAVPEAEADNGGLTTEDAPEAAPEADNEVEEALDGAADPEGAAEDETSAVKLGGKWYIRHSNGDEDDGPYKKKDMREAGYEV